jgi:lipopolysaccharide/colanic/teichoic acid biosynthesis glycosyltransferase
MFAKRIFDILFSFVGLVLLLPIFFIISVLIIFESKGGVFYLQTRVGQFGIDFKLFKFRTMFTDSDKRGLITIGMRDSRITKVGYFLRKYKLDELPQLMNVFIGNMSFVGPRPEVRKYVEMYNDHQKLVLNAKPGITDYASIQFSNENELLGNSQNPDETYISTIMPAKLELNLKYILEQGLTTDLKLIFKTILKIISH